MNTIVVPKHFLPSKKINMEHLPNFQHLEISDPCYYKPSPIDMIIGSDYLPPRNLKGVLSITENGVEA